MLIFARFEFDPVIYCYFGLNYLLMVIWDSFTPQKEPTTFLLIVGLQH